jgi:hypothetical protein
VTSHGHDRRAVALDEDLERWVAGDHRTFRQELDRNDQRVRSEGPRLQRAHLAARAEVKTRALQRYRDRCSESQRALADLVAAEGWFHESWRRLKKLPDLRLIAPSASRLSSMSGARTQR